MITPNRSWQQSNRNANRHRTLKQALMIASVAQSFDSWFSAEDCHQLYRDEVGQLSYRSVHRYLSTLQMVGVLQSRSEDVGNGISYRWQGWPEPLKQPHAGASA